MATQSSVAWETVENQVIAYALLVLCAAQLFGLPQVSAYTYQKCAKTWNKRGCRIDYHRALTPLFTDKGPNATVQIDWDNFEAYVYDLTCRCKDATIKAGNSFFCIEEYGICMSGDGNISHYLKNYPLDPEEKCVGVMENDQSIVSQKDGELCVGGVYRCYFYELTSSNVGSAPASAPAEEEEEEDVIRCNKVSDVLILLDTSGTINANDMILVKEFLQKFVNRYDFSTGKSRLGIIAYDEKCHVELTWLDSTSLTVAQIRDKVTGIQHTKGSTLTHVALQCAMEKIIKHSQRPGVPKTILLLTDGVSYRGSFYLPTPSKKLRDMGCKVLAIGVGDADVNELELITGTKAQIFPMKSFKYLLDHAAKTLNNFIEKSCAP